LNQLSTSPIALLIILVYVSGLAFSIGRIYEQLRQAKREAAQQSVQADGAEAAANGLVYKVEWVDADTIRLTPRR
jgi:hypothetical protein